MYVEIFNFVYRLHVLKYRYESSASANDSKKQNNKNNRCVVGSRLRHQQVEEANGTALAEEPSCDEGRRMPHA